jgi:DNA helicase HerA-like ATPase
VVKVPTKNSVAFGMVNALSIAKPARNGDGVESRFLELELVGESVAIGTGKGANMRRGVSTYPVLGSPVYAATQADLRFVFVRDGPQSARIGSIQQDPNLPAQVNVDDLLGKHFAVLGATGTGKSCAVTLILKAILKRNPNGHILLLDPHNEYARAFGAQANVIDLHKLELPHWLFNFTELRAVLTNAGASISNVEAALLNDLITQAKRQFLGATADERTITSDTPTPYRIGQVADYIEDVLGRLDKPESIAQYQALKTAIVTLQNDARFGFMFAKGVTTRDLMVPILSSIFRVPVQGKPITILDLSGVPFEILNVVVSVLCRTAFDFATWSRGKWPILLVCEEAHLYAPENPEAGFEPTKRVLSRIAKEGRKYGLSLGIASQRPAELSATMLSQCSTIFAMRLTNEIDQQWVRSSLSDGIVGLLEALGTLGTAEAIGVGEGIVMPMRLVFDTLAPDERPRSATASFSTAWKTDNADDREKLQGVVDQWRRQRHDD